MRRTHCGGCGSDQLEVFLDLGKTPLADRFPATPDEPEDTWPLEVAVCRACWLVQLLEIVPDELLWDESYAFYSGASPSKVAEHETLAADLLAAYPDQAKRLTVEIACNDGDLLRHFADAGCRAVGVDPARGPWEVANERGLEALLLPFGKLTAEAINETYGSAGLIIARNVAAHVADLDDFFGGIAELLAPDGVAVVEVQYLADLLAGNQFDHVYHEHRFFFSATSLERVTARHGLRCVAAVHTAQQGGSMRFVFRHGVAPSGGLMWNYFDNPAWGLEDLGTYRAFAGRVEYLRERLNDLLAEQQHLGREVVGFAATAKSTTLLNFCGIGPETLPYVEDTTPAKIGRYTPGTHIPIISEDDARRRGLPNVKMLLAWNYLAGVLDRDDDFNRQGGRWLVPIPVPVLL